MNNDSIAIIVYAGATTPARVSASFLDAIDEVVIRQTHDGTSTFQMLLDADVTNDSSSDFGVLSDGMVAPGNRVKIAVQLGTSQQVLLDGVVTFQELTFDGKRGRFVLSVIGEDLSVYMRITDQATEWPARSPSQIVTEILGNYAQYGLEAAVTVPENNFMPTADQWIRQQNANDLAYVRELARQFGFIFCLQPGTQLSSSSTAYWGPPPRGSVPLPSLSVAMGAWTNVREIEFKYDAASASAYGGSSRQDDASDAPLTVVSAPFSLAPLAASGAWKSPLARTQRFIQPNLDGALATAYANASAQIASRAAVQVKVSLDSLRYQTIVMPTAIVPVRGVGETYGGNYYVELVKHTLRRGSYVQDLQMSREGLGTTVTTVRA